MRALDRATIEEVGIPGFTLMETAGRGVADVAVRMLRGSNGARIAVVCGPGNNGGDGFVIARVLDSRGFDAVAYLAIDRAKVAGDARAHLEVLERSGGVVRSIATPAELAEHAAAITSADLAIDAVFGTGLARAVEGHLARVIETVNQAPQRLAVDIPSGLATDTGQTLGVAVDAHATATMAANKVALAGAPGFVRCGTVTVVDIGVPPGLLAASTPRAGVIERGDVARWLPHAAAMDHKGRRGHALIVGGKPEMRGAGRLASLAALRAGAGLVTLTADQPPPDIAITDPANSVMTSLVRAPADLTAALDGKAGVVIGPGLGTSEHARGLLDAVLAAGVPAVLDADALNLLAALNQAAGTTAELPDTFEPDVVDAWPAVAIARAAGPVAITPHPAEAARLLGVTTAAVEADRLTAARALARLTRAVVVLKGARTVICDGTLGDEFCSINPTGGPALGTAGSGDVLAGTLGALLAQGVPAIDAARIAVHVHGLAGDALAEVHGDRGVMSSDLPAAIAVAIRDLR